LYWGKSGSGICFDLKNHGGLLDAGSSSMKVAGKEGFSFEN